MHKLVRIITYVAVFWDIFENQASECVYIPAIEFTFEHLPLLVNHLSQSTERVSKNNNK